MSVVDTADIACLSVGLTGGALLLNDVGLIGLLRPHLRGRNVSGRRVLLLRSRLVLCAGAPTAANQQAEDTKDNCDDSRDGQLPLTFILLLDGLGGSLLINISAGDSILPLSSGMIVGDAHVSALVLVMPDVVRLLNECSTVRTVVDSLSLGFMRISQPRLGVTTEIFIGFR